MAYYSHEFERQTEWLSYADIQDIEFVKVNPREGYASFKVTYWDPSDDSDYGMDGGLHTMTVNFPYDLDWDSDEDGEFNWVDFVGLCHLEGKLTDDQVDYMYESISDALGI